jgi:hypothetical protein
VRRRDLASNSSNTARSESNAARMHSSVIGYHYTEVVNRR